MPRSTCEFKGSWQPLKCDASWNKLTHGIAHTLAPPPPILNWKGKGGVIVTPSLVVCWSHISAWFWFCDPMGQHLALKWSENISYLLSTCTENSHRHAICGSLPLIYRADRWWICGWRFVTLQWGLRNDITRDAGSTLKNIQRYIPNETVRVSRP